MQLQEEDKLNLRFPILLHVCGQKWKILAFRPKSQLILLAGHSSKTTHAFIITSKENASPSCFSVTMIGLVTRKQKPLLLSKINFPFFACFTFFPCQTWTWILQYTIQGDPNKNLKCLLAITLKLCIFDPMLVKPKCVWEAYNFFEKF